MTRYQKKNWREEWQRAKEPIRLSTVLFRKGLGKDLDAQEATYEAMMKADARTFPKLAAEHGKRAVKIRATLDAYRKIVKDKDLGVDASNVLNDIDTKFLSPQLDDRLHRQDELKRQKV